MQVEKESVRMLNELMDRAKIEGRQITAEDMEPIHKQEHKEWEEKQAKEEEKRNKKEDEIRVKDPDRYDGVEKVIEEYIQNDEPYFEMHLMDGGMDMDEDIRPLLYKVWDAACQYMANKYLPQPEALEDNYDNTFEEPIEDDYERPWEKENEMNYELNQELKERE